MIPHEARARRLFAQHLSNGPEPAPWLKKFDATLKMVKDHPDYDRMRRARDVLVEAQRTLEQIESECEVAAVSASIRRDSLGALYILDDALIDMMCAADAWDAERDWRSWGDTMDAQRAMRGP